MNKVKSGRVTKRATPKKSPVKVQEISDDEDDDNVKQETGVEEEPEEINTFEDPQEDFGDEF